MYFISFYVIFNIYKIRKEKIKNKKLLIIIGTIIIILVTTLIILTDEFDFAFGKGFKLEMDIYGQSNLFNYYYVENDNLYIIDFVNNEIIDKAKIYDDKIDFLNQDGSIKETYTRK